VSGAALAVCWMLVSSLDCQGEVGGSEPAGWVTVAWMPSSGDGPCGPGRTRVRGRVATSVLVALASLTATAAGIAVSLATSGQSPGWLQPYRHWGWRAVLGRGWPRRRWRGGGPAGKPAPTVAPPPEASARPAARWAAATCRSPARRARPVGGMPPRSWVSRGSPPSRSSTSSTRRPLRRLPVGSRQRPGRCRTCRPAALPSQAAKQLPDSLARSLRVGVGGGGRPTTLWWGRHPAGGRRGR
jgi:hypothetical protein